MSLLNRVLDALLDGLQRPIAGLPPEVGLLLWSLVAAVVMLLVVKRTSNQEALAAVKRQIHACMFEIRLLNDDLGAILRAQVELLRHNGRYLLLSLPPLGVNLFIASIRFEKPILRLYTASLPFIAILLFALAVITYVPWFSLVLVR